MADTDCFYWFIGTISFMFFLNGLPMKEAATQRTHVNRMVNMDFETVITDRVDLAVDG